MKIIRLKSEPAPSREEMILEIENALHKVLVALVNHERRKRRKQRSKGGTRCLEIIKGSDIVIRSRDSLESKVARFSNDTLGATYRDAIRKFGEMLAELMPSASDRSKVANRVALRSRRYAEYRCYTLDWVWDGINGWYS